MELERRWQRAEERRAVADRRFRRAWRALQRAQAKHRAVADRRFRRAWRARALERAQAKHSRAVDASNVARVAANAAWTEFLAALEAATEAARRRSLGISKPPGAPQPHAEGRLRRTRRTGRHRAS